jgi:hypothetical protein
MFSIASLCQPTIPLTTPPADESSSMTNLTAIAAISQASMVESSLSPSSIQPIRSQKEWIKDYLQTLIEKLRELGHEEVSLKLTEIRNSMVNPDKSEEKSSASDLSAVSTASVTSLLSRRRARYDAHIASLNSEIFYAIKDLRSDDLTVLEGVPRPKSIRNVYANAKAYQKIPSALSKENELEKYNEEAINSCLLDVCRSLFKENKIEEALEHAQYMSEDYYKSLALMEISMFVLKLPEGKEQALQIARSIPGKCRKARALLEAEQTEEAFRALQNITFAEAEEHGFKAVKTFAKMYKLCKTPDNFIKNITDEGVRSLFLIEIGQIDEGMKLAESIYTKDPNHILQFAFDAFIRVNKIDRAIEVTLKIKDPDTKSECLLKLQQLNKRN